MGDELGQTRADYQRLDRANRRKDIAFGSLQGTIARLHAENADLHTELARKQSDISGLQRENAESKRRVAYFEERDAFKYFYDKLLGVLGVGKGGDFKTRALKISAVLGERNITVSSDVAHAWCLRSRSRNDELHRRRPLPDMIKRALCDYNMSEEVIQAILEIITPPPARAGWKVTPPGAGRKVTPTRAGRKVTPPGAGRKVTPTRAGWKVTPTRADRKVTLTRAGRKVTPTRADRKVTLTRAGRKVTPARAGRKVTLTRAGRKVTPTRAGRGSTPAGTGRKVTPTRAGRGSTPAGTGRGSTPTEAGRSTPTSRAAASQGSLGSEGGNRRRTRSGTDLQSEAKIRRSSSRLAQ